MLLGNPPAYTRDEPTPERTLPTVSESSAAAEPPPPYHTPYDPFADEPPMDHRTFATLVACGIFCFPVVGLALVYATVCEWCGIRVGRF